MNHTKRIPIALLMFCSGCATFAPDASRIEIEHVSHPLAGYPSGARAEEDGLTQVNALARWKSGRFYVEQGIGYNLKGRDGGGFYGPGLTYTGRVGIEFDFTHEP
jgi:hypothetical protein